MALVTLQTIFQDAFPAYEPTHPLACPRPQSRTRHYGPAGASVQEPTVLPNKKT